MTNTLSRSNDDKILAGVCGGIARRFGFDSTLTRIGFFLISILSAAFPGILVYVFLWIIMPDDYGVSSKLVHREDENSGY